MKKFISILSFILLMGSISISTQAKNEATQDQEIKSVTAYYFHATRRCETCKAVEVVAKEAIKEYYGDKVDFIIINREKAKNKKLVQKYQISGQTLLIVSGDKAVNLTTNAFLNARTNPDKLKSKIKTTIDAMI
jgi:hypothetical protein